MQGYAQATTANQGSIQTMVFIAKGKYKQKALAVIAITVLCQGCASFAKNPDYSSNSSLSSVKPDFPGNPYKHGRFIGPYRSISSGGESIWNYATWKLNPYRKRSQSNKHSDTPVVTYQQQAHIQKPHIVWLGHATVLLHLNGQSILVDPILKSPRFFHGSRLGRLPVAADELSIDILLATHAHRDHLDKQTVKQLSGSTIKAFIPLKMGNLIRRWRPDIDVQEAGWYQSYNTQTNINITLLPAYHWSRRNLFDTNTVLWASYLVKTEDATVFIAGDTGYADHFKEIGTLFDDIDYAILPIGSYEPDHIHRNSHMTPEQAIQAFEDLNAKTMIPVHYGTFDLSDEPITEPMERLIKEIKRKSLPQDKVLNLAIGEAHYVNSGN